MSEDGQPRKYELDFARLRGDGPALRVGFESICRCLRPGQSDVLNGCTSLRQFVQHRRLLKIAADDAAAANCKFFCTQADRRLLQNAADSLPDPPYAATPLSICSSGQSLCLDGTKISLKGMCTLAVVWPLVSTNARNAFLMHLTMLNAVGCHLYC